MELQSGTHKEKGRTSKIGVAAKYMLNKPMEANGKPIQPGGGCTGRWWNDGFHKTV